MNSVKSYYDGLPKKRMSAGALFFNENEELLIVKPTYKEGWLVPGGVVEDRESPMQACAREVQEEIGLQVQDLRLLWIEYKSNKKEEKTESLNFLFFGGILRQDQIDNIVLEEKELSEFCFVSLEEAVHMMSGGLQDRVLRVREIIKNGTMVYFEDGIRRDYESHS